MKTAIVCDWLITYAGSERVLGEMIHCFPDADLFSVVDFLPSNQRAFLKNKPVKTTRIQHFPLAKKLYRSYLPWMPLAIEQLDLSSYDLVISSSHAVAKGALTGPHQLHISYIHSPMRYAWDLQHQYLRETGLNHGIKGYIAQYFLHKMRIWDQRTANGVDHFIANSKFIAARIWKTYRREAHVIYPPVDISSFTPYLEKEDYYVTASRLVPYKKIDLIVEAFTEMPDKKLVVIGSGPQLSKIKAKATKNIEILGYQPNEILIHHLQRAKAFVFAAEEDFGLLPLEAQACGTPVIAYGKGGALETVRGLHQENPTGLFFDQHTISALREAVTQFETHPSLFLPKNCVNHAAHFSPHKFREEFNAFVLRQLP
ncbi:MAG: pimB [Gammaproteobacteria bacterium]|jgi:glycosyltransferase involved in cell wall biosynthesis|nr:pimB [Gammaproteobacteria bacterium]